MSSELQGSLERLMPGDVDALEHEWRALETQCGQSFFISWSWIGPWLQLVLPRVEVLVFRARRGTQTVALGTLARYRCTRSRILPATVVALNEATLDGLDMVIEYNDLLGQSDCLAGSRRLLLSLLVSGPFGWSELQLGAISAAWREALGAFDGRVYELAPELRAPWIRDISGLGMLSDVLAMLSRNRRGKIRQSIRQFETAYGPLRSQEPLTVEQALQAFDRMGELHTARWNRAGLGGCWANPHWVAFHREVIRVGFERGEIQLLSLFARDTLLGTIYSFLHDGRVYMLQSGFMEPRLNAERPGYVAHCMAMAVNGARGYTVYDFMCGDAEYKRSLGCGDTPLEWTRYRRHTLWNRLEDRLIDIYRTNFKSSSGPTVPVVSIGEGVSSATSHKSGM